ncbi:MAG TPA: helix-turn-helix domain-containing protein [Planctomycetota bacterium]|nr:helix-turn-helix domain-containing protein [Planctomycetota bacterium]
MARTKKTVSCPVEITLAVIGGRWKVLVLQQLFESVLRFNALHRALPGISHRTLTKQLRELERDGVVARRVFQQVPPKVEYSLTALGRTLEPILLAMHAWAVNHGTGRTQKAKPMPRS